MREQVLCSKSPDSVSTTMETGLTPPPPVLSSELLVRRDHIKPELRILAMEDLSSSIKHGKIVKKNGRVVSTPPPK